MHVVRCLHVAYKDKDYRRPSVFHTYVTHESKSYKVMIDGGSSIQGFKYRPQWIFQLENFIADIVIGEISRIFNQY